MIDHQKQEEQGGETKSVVQETKKAVSTEKTEKKLIQPLLLGIKSKICKIYRNIGLILVLKRLSMFFKIKAVNIKNIREMINKVIPV